MVKIGVEGISKSFGGLRAVDNVSLEVGEGEILGVIGPNGSGKTTLFNLISGFYAPDQGKVYLDGKRIDGLKPYQICKLGLARTFQVMQTFANLSAFDTVVVAALNCHYSLASAKIEAEKILDLVGLKEKARLGKASLTGPDLKALELAKALATGAKVLLLDEVMSGLTQTETNKMISVIRQLQEEGQTFVLVEHVMAVVMGLAKRIVVLDFGQRIAEGSPQEISTNQAVIDCYLGSEEALA